MREIILSYWNWFAVDLIRPYRDEITAISTIVVAIFTVVPQEPPQGLFLYVWGRATYRDGFRWRKRYANFCHRYPWEMRETPTGGGVRISTEHARYHDYGNSAT